MIFLTFFFLHNAIAIRPPCGLRGAGILCVNDEDCDGPHSVCLGGVCNCPSNFELFAIDNRTQVCRPAPSQVGAKCQSACRPPLVCQNNACVCWKADNVNGKCVINCPAGQVLVNQECRAAAAVAGKCEKDGDCIAAFTYCKGGLCDCVPGATRKGTDCVATCPDGSAPGAICRKKFINDANVYYNGETTDTCPKGAHCVTYGKPEVGQCCPLLCPYGTADLSKSCKAGASGNSKCPELTTHYCQEFETKGAVDRLCCPRPCRDPTPLYIDGKCLPMGHWGDPCQKPEQCEGGSSMACNNGRCDCKPNFVQRNYTFPTCEPNCGLAVALNGQCLQKVGVGDACGHSGQCPVNGHCREGVCECDCGFVIRGGGCSNPDDPLNVGGLLGTFQQLLGGKKPGADASGSSSG